MDTEEMDIFTHVFEELDAESISRSAAMAEIKTILRKKDSVILREINCGADLFFRRTA